MVTRTRSYNTIVILRTWILCDADGRIHTRDVVATEDATGRQASLELKLMAQEERKLTKRLSVVRKRREEWDEVKTQSSWKKLVGEEVGLTWGVVESSPKR